MNKIGAILLGLLAVAVVVPVVIGTGSFGLANSSAPVTVAPVVAASMSAPVTTGAHIEIASQTSTTLSMRFYDASNAQVTLGFSRSGASDPWRTTSTGSPGIIFGNSTPVYASAARCRALGIMPEQALTTFDVAICNRPFDDVTIFQTYGGMAIGLWQGGAITEIWYVGSLVQAAIERAQSDPNMHSACENLKAECCNTKTNPADPPGGPSNPIPTPDMDACASVVNNPNCPDQDDAVCDCLANICSYCPHPAADPPPTPCPCCEDGLQGKSTKACDLYSHNCPPPEPSPPPPPPPWEEILRLLQEILERLQHIFDRMPMN